MSNSYTVKNLRVTFTLTGSNAVFPGTNANQLQVSGLRMSVTVKAAGAAQSTTCTMQIYGMSQQDMNALSVVPVLNGTPGFINNTVLVEGDSGQGYTAIFAGAIIQAGADYSNAPDVCLSVQAQTGFYESIAVALPTSFPGATDVATAVSVIAAKMGVPFVNNGVNQVLPGGGYFSGSLHDQLERICAAAHIAWKQDGAQSIVTIAPWGSSLDITPFTLSPTSGLVGYPHVRGDGFVEVRTQFNPAFLLLGPITIAGSDEVVIGNNLPTTYNSKADGQWLIGTLTHLVESQKPGGAWFSDMLLFPANSPTPSAAT